MARPVALFACPVPMLMRGQDPYGVTMFYPGLNSESLIANLDSDNNIILLCDGSNWQARRMDARVLASWNPGQLIRVTKGDVDKYPFALSNMDIFSQQRIMVKLLDVFLPGDDAWPKESGVEARLID